MPKSKEEGSNSKTASNKEWNPFFVYCQSAQMLTNDFTSRMIKNKSIMMVFSNINTNKKYKVLKITTP